MEHWLNASWTYSFLPSGRASNKWTDQKTVGESKQKEKQESGLISKLNNQLPTEKKRIGKAV